MRQPGGQVLRRIRKIARTSPDRSEARGPQNRKGWTDFRFHEGTTCSLSHLSSLCGGNGGIIRFGKERKNFVAKFVLSKILKKTYFFVSSSLMILIMTVAITTIILIKKIVTIQTVANNSNNI